MVLTQAPLSTTAEPVPSGHMRGGVASLVSEVVGTAIRSAAVVWLAHTLVVGVLLVFTAYKLAADISLGFSASAVLAVVIIHAIAVPIVLSAGAMFACSTAIVRAGVARRLMAAAAARASSLDPRLGGSCNLAALRHALETAFDELATESAEAEPRGLLGRMRRRLTRRLVRTIGRAVLTQLELMPGADGRPELRTVDEWLGSRIDHIVARSVRDPAVRLMVLVLLGQVVATAAVLFTARALPATLT